MSFKLESSRRNSRGNDMVLYCLLITWILCLILSFLLWILVKIPMSFSNYMVFSIDMFTPHTLHPLLLLRTDAPMWITSVHSLWLLNHLSQWEESAGHGRKKSELRISASLNRGLRIFLGSLLYRTLSPATSYPF